MLRFISIAVSVGLLLLPKLAAADPINLKLSFFTSDRSVIYRNSVKPLVDAVNAEGAGVVHIDVYFSGAISAVQNQQPRLVSEDAADLALIVPGQTAGTFLRYLGDGIGRAVPRCPGGEPHLYGLGTGRHARRL